MLKYVRYGDDMRDPIMTRCYPTGLIATQKIFFCPTKVYNGQRQNWEYLIFIDLPLWCRRLLLLLQVTRLDVKNGRLEQRGRSSSMQVLRQKFSNSDGRNLCTYRDCAFVKR